MTLDPTKLVSSLRKLSKLPTSPGDKSDLPETVEDAAKAWANLYADYAADALAADAKPVFEGAATLLETNFLVAMKAQNFPATLPENLTIFWMTPPVKFAGVAGAGVPTLVTGTAALVTAIADMAVKNLAAETEYPLDGLAAALDVFTKTVSVALINPAGVTVPTLLL